MVVAASIYGVLAAGAVVVVFALPDRRWLDHGWSPSTDRLLVSLSLLLWVLAPAVMYFWLWRLPRLFLSAPRSVQRPLQLQHS